MMTRVLCTRCRSTESMWPALLLSGEALPPTPVSCTIGYAVAVARRKGLITIEAQCRAQLPAIVADAWCEHHRLTIPIPSADVLGMSASSGLCDRLATFSAPAAEVSTLAFIG